MYLNETYSRVWVDKDLSDMLPAKSGLKKKKKGDSSSPLLVKFALTYAICHEEGSGKTGGLEIKCCTSAFGLS